MAERQVQGQFQFLPREEIQAKMPGSPSSSQAPVGGVYRPHGARTEVDRENVQVWTSALANFNAGLGKISAAAIERQRKAEFLDGQMAQMAGQTWEQMKESGASNATTQGFATMQAVAYSQKWMTEKMAAINDGRDAAMEPALYYKQLQDEFKTVLTGNEFTDNVTTALAVDTMPKLASEQLLANAKWKEERTFDSFRDSVVAASTANNSELTSTLISQAMQQGIAGLSAERTRDAIAQAVTLDYANGGNTAAKSLGIHSFSRDAAKSDERMLSMPEISRGIISSIADPGVHGGKATPELMMRIASIESGGNPQATGPETTRGRGRAKGMFQFLDSTWAQYGSGGNVFNPEDATRGAVKYMNYLLDKFDGNETYAVMAYHAGEGSVSRWISGGKKPGFDPTTIQYAKDVLGVDAYEAQGKSILGLGFGAAQQEKMMRGRKQYIESKRNQWSLDHAVQAEQIRQEFNERKIGYSEALQRALSIGMSEDMVKSYFGMFSTIEAQNAAERYRINSSISPETTHAMQYIVDLNHTNNVDPATAISNIRNTLSQAGIRPDEIDKAVNAYLIADERFQVKSLKEQTQAERRFSSTQQAAIGEISALLTEDPASLDQAKAAVDNILFDRTDSIRQEVKDDLDKEYGKKVGAAYQEGRTVKISVLTDQEQNALLSLKSRIQRATLEPGADAIKVKADMESELAAMAEMFGWDRDAAGKAKLNTARGFLFEESKSAMNAIFSQLRREQMRASKEQATLDRGIELYQQQRLYQATPKERAAAYQVLQQEIAEQTRKMLDQQKGPGNYTQQEALEATAIKMGDLLASQGTDAMHDDSKGMLHSMSSTPAITKDASGRDLVDPMYISKFKMYKQIYDQDRALAAKYAGEDVSMLMRDIMIKNETGLDPNDSIIQAFAERGHYRDVDPQKFSAYTNTKEFKELVSSAIPDAVDNLLPSWVNRTFSTAPDTPGYSVSSESIQRLQNDPVFLSMVHDRAAYYKQRNPAMPDSAIAEQAAVSAASTLRVAHGNFIRGSSQNQGDVLIDLNIPANMRTDTTLTSMLHKYLDKHDLISDSQFRTFHSADASRAADGSFIKATQKQTTGYVAPVMNTEVLYTPATRTFLVTFYNQDTGERSTSLRINGMEMAQEYVNDLVKEERERFVKSRTPSMGRLIDSLFRGELAYESQLYGW